MTLVLVFATTLAVATLFSELARRSVISTAVLFLVAGFAVGEGSLHLVPLRPGDDEVRLVAKVALFAILFTDGMRVGVEDLKGAWRLPGRALIFGLPVGCINWVRNLDLHISGHQFTFI